MADQSIQRRLAAVLVADVADYTRLVEQDSGTGRLGIQRTIRDGGCPQRQRGARTRMP